MVDKSQKQRQDMCFTWQQEILNNFYVKNSKNICEI